MTGPAACYEDALGALCDAREDVVVMTAENRAAIRGLPSRLGPRFVDVGISEQTLVGAAAGLALRGRTPVVHGLAAFLVMRAFEFIRTDVALASLPVKLVGFIPGLLSEANGPTHQAIEDVALMRAIPGMHVFCPADRAELVAGLPAMVASRAPWYVRYNDGEPEVAHNARFETGVAERLAEGGDVALLSYGVLVGQAEAARRLLEEQGIRVALLNLRTLQPLDEAAILAAAERARLMVTLEDHLARGGLGASVAELLCGRRAPRLLRIDLGERWFRPGLLPDVLAHEGFTGGQVAKRIRAALEE
jgi:transketolase